MTRETVNRITGIGVSISTEGKYGGTNDPLYLGVICADGSSIGRSGREFPLRYKKSNTNLEGGKSYGFGFGVVDPGYTQAWDADGTGKNGLEQYPLRWDQVSRVYIRKEPITASRDSDDLIVIGSADVLIWGDNETSDIERKTHFGNVYVDALTVTLYLGNEYGASVDLFNRDS